MQYPDKVRLYPRIEKPGAPVKIIPPQPIGIGSSICISITQPAPECRSVQQQTFEHALRLIGNIRNAFALRNIRLQTGDGSVHVEHSKDQLVLIAPVTASIDDMTAAFHDYINTSMAEIMNSGDVYSGPMLLLDDAFIEMAMRNAKRTERYEFMATLRDTKAARNRLCNSGEIVKK